MVRLTDTQKGAIRQSSRISLRTTDHAKAVMEEASRIMGVSMSQFILTVAYDKSLQVLQDTQGLWRLSGQDGEQIASLLDNPPPPNKAMMDLMAGLNSIKDNT